MPNFNHKTWPFFLKRFLVDFKARIGFAVQEYQKILTPKIAFRGLYLYYSASYGQFTDFKILHEGF